VGNDSHWLLSDHALGGKIIIMLDRPLLWLIGIRKVLDFNLKLKEQGVSVIVLAIYMRHVFNVADVLSFYEWDQSGEG
jgi:hypothetical protein